MVETEKQLLESGMSTEFEEDLNMAIGEDDTDEEHDNEDSINDNEEPEQDMENESLLSDANSDQEDDEDISFEESNKIDVKSKNDQTDHEDEIENEDSRHSDVSEQADVGEDLWEDIYGRQRDKKGNIVSKKYVPPAARNASANITVDNEKARRLEKQLKGILNRLAEQNMHTIANQVIIQYILSQIYKDNKLLI